MHPWTRPLVPARYQLAVLLAMLLVLVLWISYAAVSAIPCSEIDRYPKGSVHQCFDPDGD